MAQQLSIFWAQAMVKKHFMITQKKQFIPYIETLLQTGNRVDVVLDQYLPNSLKSALWEKRGSGVCYKVQTKVKLPRKWADFLFVDENKSELFQYLASETSQHKFRENKQIVITKGAEVLTINHHKMSDCTHQEADSKIFLHIMEALEEGNNCIMIQTVDTDLHGKIPWCSGKVSRFPSMD